MRKLTLQKSLPKDILKIITKINDIADRLNLRVYLVGGPVRDLLFRRPNYDLDFTVEGDGINFAKELNKRFKGRLITYRAFGTATIDFQKRRIDIATARREVYKRPAAYPDVEPCNIKEDLFRRDFTINALAISINKADFGKLVDFFGGIRDFKNGLIRVMHNKSFIDDPTRIFRAVRFEQRYNFKIERQTLKLLKEAVSGGLIGELNKGRIRKEIELILKEKDPIRCLRRLEGLMVW